MRMLSRAFETIELIQLDDNDNPNADNDNKLCLKIASWSILKITNTRNVKLRKTPICTK